MLIGYCLENWDAGSIRMPKQEEKDERVSKVKDFNVRVLEKVSEVAAEYKYFAGSKTASKQEMKELQK